MYSVAGPPGSSCNLVVPFLPPGREKFEPRSFDLEFPPPKSLHYDLPDQGRLNAYARNESFKNILWFHKSRLKYSDDSNKVIYFEVCGPISKAAILRIVHFLGLYTGHNCSIIERELHLEAGGSSIYQSIHLLQDISRISLLRYFCSEKNYDSAEELQGVLLNFMTLQPVELQHWLISHPKFEHLENYLTEMLSRFIQASKDGLEHSFKLKTQRRSTEIDEDKIDLR